jgi:hypothetical protein
MCANDIPVCEHLYEGLPLGFPVGCPYIYVPTPRKYNHLTFDDTPLSNRKPPSQAVRLLNTCDIEGAMKLLLGSNIPESASRPLVDFGVLNDNVIK